MQGLYASDVSWLDTAGRLLMVAYFLITGARNLQPHQVDDHIQRLAAFNPPLPATAVFWTGLALEFVGCALLLLDWYAAVGVLCLLVFTVAASVLLLRFWEVDDPAKRIGMQNGMFANIGVVGGLLLLLENVR